MPVFYIGWHSGGIHGLWFSLPDCRVASLALGQVQFYSTSGGDKDGPPKQGSDPPPTAEKVLAGATKSPAASGNKVLHFLITDYFI